MGRSGGVQEQGWVHVCVYMCMCVQERGWVGAGVGRSRGG